MQDRDISPPNFAKYCKRVKNILKLRPTLETEPRLRLKQIEKEQQEKILKQERKEGKEIFLQQIANSSVTQGVNAI